MSITVTFQGNNYSIPETSETGWGALTDYLVALANAASSNSFLQAIRTTTAASTTLTAADATLLVNCGIAATVTLPAGITKTIYFIFDTSNNAVTNNITVNTTGGQLIDAGTSYVIKSNMGGLMVQFDGTKWKVLSERLGDQITVLNKTVNASFVDSAIIARSTFATAANGQSCSASFGGSNAIEFLVALDSGEALKCFTSFKSSTISAANDMDNLFNNGITISKAGNSSTVTFTNATGASKVVEIRSQTNRILSMSAWA